jgi:hypothetical protein
VLAAPADGEWDDANKASAQGAQFILDSHPPKNDATKI